MQYCNTAKIVVVAPRIRDDVEPRDVDVEE